MLSASVVSEVVAVVSAFGLGGIVGAFANHFFAQRRETAAEQRALADRTYREDRVQALELRDLADGLRRALGGRRSPYFGDGGKRAWGPKERARAKQGAAVLAERIGALAGIGRALHNQKLAGEVGWTVSVIETACEALKEGEPSPAVRLVDHALRAVDNNAQAFLQRRPQPSNVLRTAWSDELGASLGRLGESKSEFLHRVSARLLKKQREALRQRRATGIRTSSTGIPPSLAWSLTAPEFRSARGARRGTAGSRPRRRGAPPPAG